MWSFSEAVIQGGRFSPYVAYRYAYRATKPRAPQFVILFFAPLPYLKWIVVWRDPSISDAGLVTIAKEPFVRLATRIIALGITLLAAAGCGPATPPSDASIIARFNAHRAEFSRLLEMFDQDGINGRLGCFDSTDDARGPQPIAPPRRAEYVKIFRMIGCDGAVYYSPGAKEKASFSMWSVGMLFAGQDKSILLFPGEAPTPVVETTDGYHWTQTDHQRGDVELYRHIDGPWYLGYVAN